MSNEVAVVDLPQDEAVLVNSIDEFIKGNPKPNEGGFERWLTTLLYNRIHKRNLNALIGLYGPPGSGKSYTALRIGELVDPNFSVDNIVFTVEELYSFINQPHPVGTAVVGDDFGLAANSRRWQSDPNIAMSYLAQSFRFMRFCTIITLPDISALDSQVRQLFHLSLQTIRKDYEHKVVIMEPRRPIRYMTSKKVFWKYPRTDSNSEIVGARIKRIAFHLPETPGLVEAYEAKRESVMKELYRTTEAKLKTGPKTPDWAEKAVLELSKTHTQNEVAKLVGLSRKHVNELVGRAKARETT